MKILLTLALLLAACTAPHVVESPAPSGPSVAVAITRGLDWTDWREDQRRAIESYLPTLSRVGVQWILVREDRADVLVRSWDSGEGCAQGAARYTRGTPFVEIDAACVQGVAALRYAVGHELLHWLTARRSPWLGHVCKRGDEALDCHPTVRGRSLLNPILPEDNDDEALGALVLDPTPTDTDRELLRVLGITR